MEKRGKTLVLTVIGATFGAQFATTAALVAWGFDPLTEQLLHSEFGVPPLRVGDLIADQFVSSVLAIVLLWALYTGRLWARWVCVALLTLAFGLLVVVHPPLLPFTRWSLLISTLICVYAGSIGALLVPATGQFLRGQRSRRLASKAAA